jgi:hypothetical protein
MGWEGIGVRRNKKIIIYEWLFLFVDIYINLFVGDENI